MVRRFAILVVFSIVLASPSLVWAAPGVCKAGMSSDKIRPIPEAFAAQARRVFELDMPDALIRKTVVYRCVDGRTMLCAAGANIACGKANVSRDLPGVAAWCHDHAGAGDVPMVASGHDTIYHWRCAGGQPKIAGRIDAVDARGFLQRSWKQY